MERKCLETLEQFINMYIIIINDMIEGLFHFACLSNSRTSYYGDYMRHILQLELYLYRLQLLMPLCRHSLWRVCWMKPLNYESIFVPLPNPLSFAFRSSAFWICDVVSLQNEIQYDPSMVKIATQTKLQLGLLAFFRSKSKDWEGVLNPNGLGAWRGRIHFDGRCWKTRCQ